MLYAQCSIVKDTGVIDVMLTYWSVVNEWSVVKGTGVRDSTSSSPKHMRMHIFDQMGARTESEALG